jgi:5-methylcytosine-specific restriction endonuclease McrA
VALHHINGDRLDNRLENLQLLCPNCHSQTSTYSGRNGHRRHRPHELARERPLNSSEI